MTEDLQSVIEPKPWHPDADQLTAFAEQALPVHEREQTLAHLAVCSACRETVFLARQAAPEATPQPVPLRRPWFAGWNLLWPAAAALAAVAGFSVYLRHGARVEAPPPVTVAVAKPEQRLPAPEPIPAPEAKLKRQPKTMTPAVAGAAAAKLPPPPPPPELAAENRIHGALVLPKPAIAVTSAAGYFAGQGTSQQGMAQQGMAQQAAAAPVNMPPQTQGALAAEAIDPVTQASPQTARLQLQAPLAAPAPAAPAPVQQAAQLNEAVTAAGIADSLSDIRATSDSSAKLAALLPELPSHLETVSSISNGMATVAVDAGGAVFESRDDGKHWKTVDAPWAGRPVKVSLEESRTAKKRGASVPDEAALDRRRSAPADQAELHGTVTDQTGASIAGAKVQVTASGTPGGGATVQADGQGNFAVPGLAAGRYQVVVSSPGFLTLTRVLSLDAGVATGMNATLAVGAASEAVTVESNAPAKAVKSPGFQLTTDSGAVWISSDGRKWKQR